RILGADQGVVVGQEEEALHPRRGAGRNRRADGTQVVAQVRDAGGLDAGEDAKRTVGHCHGVVNGPPFYPFGHRSRRRAGVRARKKERAGSASPLSPVRGLALMRRRGAPRGATADQSERWKSRTSSSARSR